MITINDYLYSGHTVLAILHRYEEDLRKEAKMTKSEIDLAHCNFLLQLTGLLEHNDFLTSQSMRLREYYKLLTKHYPYLAFAFRGRIKSLLRAEGKFNGYVIKYIADAYEETGRIPMSADVKNKVSMYRDLIAYRLVISLPKCHLAPGQSQEEEEIRYLYQIANDLPLRLEEMGFTPELSGREVSERSLLDPQVRPYYRDYVAEPKRLGYRSLHITFYDNIAHCHIEIQLRTKKMDDDATIGPANHLGYEERQKKERARREHLPEGVSREFDEAWKRHRLLQELDLSKLDVNMFSAYSEELINDGCGLYRGRLITPYEHLSAFQNDIID